MSRIDKHFGFKALIYFVVITGGVLSGFWIAGGMGLINRSNATNSFPVADCNVSTGDIFPPLTVLSASGAPVEIRTLLAGKKTIVAFVSPTCEPCKMLLDSVSHWQRVRDGDVGLLLLTKVTGYRPSIPGVLVCRFAPEDADLLGINVYPTIFAVNQAGEVRSSASGFSRELTEDQLLAEL